MKLSIDKTKENDIEIMAIQCVIEHFFPLTNDNNKDKTVYVDREMTPLGEQWKGGISIRDNCYFCKGFKERYNIQSLPKIRSSAQIKLWNYKDKGYNGGEFIKFSSLIETDNPDLFCVYTDYTTSFASGNIIRISLMLKDKDGFKYLTDLHRTVIFQ